MRFQRRRFLHSVSGLALGAAAPGLWGRLACAAPDERAAGGRGTVLVVVQLGGGNDGLNTVAPVRDPSYIAARPNLRVRPEQSLALAGGFGFHPKLKGMAELLERSQLAVVQGWAIRTPTARTSCRWTFGTGRLSPRTIPSVGLARRAITSPLASALCISEGGNPLGRREPVRQVDVVAIDRGLPAQGGGERGRSRATVGDSRLRGAGRRERVRGVESFARQDSPHRLGNPCLHGASRPCDPGRGPPGESGQGGRDRRWLSPW